jgi:hypothetical protein
MREIMHDIKDKILELFSKITRLNNVTSYERDAFKLVYEKS